MKRNAIRLSTLVTLGVVLSILGSYSDAHCDSLPSNQANATCPALRLLPTPHGLGVNIHFYQGDDRDWSMLEESGVGIVRMDVSWAGSEKRNNEYDFSRYDSLIAQLKKRDISLLFILDYGNPLYDEGFAPYSEKGRDQFARFAAALAKRYVHEDIIWELWNEPNLDQFWKPKSNVNDYMKWCKSVVSAIRKSNPKACIIAPATSRFDLLFLEMCFKQGLLELVDGISVHPYRNALLGPETAIDEYNILATMIEQYKPGRKHIPIISGEWGYSTTDLSPELQGNYLVRQWLCNMAYQIPVSIWYDWHDDGRDPNEPEHHFGTVTWDYQRKPGYLAMKTLIAELKGYVSVGRIGMGDVDDYIVPFREGERVKLAVWTTADSHEIDLGADLKLSKIVHQSGETSTPPNNSRLVISDKPLYLNVDAPLPLWLKLVIQADQVDEAQAQKTAQSILQRPSSDPYAGDLWRAIENETTNEREAAFHVLIRLANKTQTNRSLTWKLYNFVLGKDTHILNRKQALAGLSRMGATESLEKVTPLLNNPDLMQAAARYYLNMAFNLSGKKNSKARELLLDAARVSRDRYLVDRVISRMKEVGMEIDEPSQKTLSKSAGFINEWWVAGPFPNDKDRGESMVYFPEGGIDFAQSKHFDTYTARWKRVDLHGIYAIIPFADLFGRKPLAAYAYAELNMPERKAVIFKIGSNDGVVCWLNERRIHENFVGRGLIVDEDSINAQLEKGVNRILLKVLNKGAAWEACLRVCDANGVPLDLNQY